MKNMKKWHRYIGYGERLDCGCASGTVIYGCMHCSNTRCAEHWDQPHFCPECPACGIRHGYPLHQWDGRRLVTVGVEAS
jgi:hypothetical protein